MGPQKEGALKQRFEGCPEAAGDSSAVPVISCYGWLPGACGNSLRSRFDGPWSGKPPVSVKTARRLSHAAILALAVVLRPAKGQEGLVDFVDPRIGVSIEKGECAIGPQLPNGSINPGPQSPNPTQSGYSLDQPIRGFGQLHVSGTGEGKYGQIFVSPQVGLEVGETGHDSSKAGEVARADYYGVTLGRYAIRTEVTPARHAALYRFTFPATGDGHILIDITHNIPLDFFPWENGAVSGGSVAVDPGARRVTGHGRYTGGFGGNSYYDVYFCAVFDRAPDGFGTWLNGAVAPRKSAEALARPNDRVGAFLGFRFPAGGPVLMKIAVSLKNADQAERWLDEEIPGWDFDGLRRTAAADWNARLEKIRVEGGDAEQKRLFYTALYHAMLMPRDRTGDLPGFPANAEVWDDLYTVWDTWRTLFPLMELVEPDMVRGNIASFSERLKKSGTLKDAFTAGHDMIEEQGGNDIDNIIADACVKGLPGVNWNDAYAVVKHDADHERIGWQGWGHSDVTDPAMAAYKRRGWIPAGVLSCSKTLEYAYNDFCAAEIARKLNHKEDFQRYLVRSRQWATLWNPLAGSDGFKGFIAPREAAGQWVAIDPKFAAESWKGYFYEGSSWTYSYFAPHQFAELVSLSGGRQTFAAKLVHGLGAGLIDFSNEPAFLAQQSFHYAGRPDLASAWTRKLAQEGFTQVGCPGDDDSGAMSSWYIFAALGIFPNAGQPIYYLNGPMWRKISVRLGSGKTLLIEAPDASPRNMYVQSCEVNGESWNHSWIGHDAIRNGGTIRFEMGPAPSSWARNDPSAVDGVTLLEQAR
jgi:predicted alpha-1,2-mannosidase